jgi:predicted dehydrogenase
MTKEKLRVAIIGCGRMGQGYADVYSDFDNTEIVAIAEYNDERRKAVGQRYGVKALYKDADELFRDVVPDLAVVVLPGKYIKDAVIAAAEAGVRGVSSDKPIAARLSDADEMVAVCEKRGVVFHGGNLMRATAELQEAAGWIHNGDYGELVGASIHHWGGGEISGGGCQQVSVLRLLTQAEVSEVIAWAQPQELLEGDSDDDLIVSGMFTMSNGVPVSVFGNKTPTGGVTVWSPDSLIHWEHIEPPIIYQGTDATGARIRVDRAYTPFAWPQYGYLANSILSFISAVEHGTEMVISGHDLRQALEVAIAAKHSALRGSVPIKLPLEDRSLTLYPTKYRWLGGDVSGSVQTVEEALGVAR